MSSEKRTERPKSAFGMVSLIIIGLLSVWFLYNGFVRSNNGSVAESLVFFVLGALGIAFSFLMANRVMGTGIPLHVQKTPLTVVKCQKCSYKNIRNFQAGDYIPKSMETCPSCGAQTIIEGIFIEDTSPKKKREENF